MSGVPVWRNERPRAHRIKGSEFYYCDCRDYLIGDSEPGVWFPLSARAELREQIVERIYGSHDWIGTPIATGNMADAVVALIFGDQ